MHGWKEGEKILNSENERVREMSKEQKNSPDDMDTITMWATKSSRVMNIRSIESSGNVQNVISGIDAAKIRKNLDSTKYPRYISQIPHQWSSCSQIRDSHGVIEAKNRCFRPFLACFGRSPLLCTADSAIWRDGKSDKKHPVGRNRQGIMFTLMRYKC